MSATEVDSGAIHLLAWGLSIPACVCCFGNEVRMKHISLEVNSLAPIPAEFLEVKE